jgi:hypothetical protein
VHAGWEGETGRARKEWRMAHRPVTIPGELLETFQSLLIAGRWLLVVAETMMMLLLLITERLGQRAHMALLFLYRTTSRTSRAKKAPCFSSGDEFALRRAGKGGPSTKPPCSRNRLQVPLLAFFGTSRTVTGRPYAVAGPNSRPA